MRVHHEPDALVLVPEGAIGRADVARVLEGMTALVRAETDGRVVVDLALLEQPGLAAVDVLLRLLLACRRDGRAFAVRHAPPCLDGAVRLSGLVPYVPRDDGCPCCGADASVR